MHISAFLRAAILPTALVAVTIGYTDTSLARSRWHRDNNSAPVITGTPQETVAPGEIYFFLPQVTDKDATDSHTFKVKGKPTWTTFDEQTGALKGQPGPGDIGKYRRIRIGVSDGTEYAELPPFDIDVAEPASTVNHPPQIAGTPPGITKTRTGYTFTPDASDEDSDPLTFSIRNKPAWASFNAGRGTLEGMPEDGDAGTYDNIEIGVTDGQATTTLPAFSITVETSNSAPTIAGNPPATVTAGQDYAFQPQASDADGDTLTFSISGKPSWASFDDRTGLLSGRPTASDVNTYAGIRISVSDGQASASLSSFSITVAAGNRAPTIAGSPPTSVTAEQDYAFQPQASDADGDTLTFSISGKPSWASFDGRTGLLAGRPTAADVNSYTGIRISVSDGQATTALPTFAIDVVQSSNGAVTLSWTPPTTNTDGSPLVGLSGYVIGYGQAAGQYTESLSIANPGITSAMIENLGPATWHFAVKAVTDSGSESDYSNEAIKTIPQ
jgi:Putative Ig domain